jgi:Uncharacterised nucleotidyltransferase
MKNDKAISNLILRTCLSDSPERQLSLVKEWENQVVMDDMPYDSMRLVPLFLYKNQLASIQTKHDNRLKIIYKHWWLKTQHILNQLKKVHSALRDNGINAIVIKGASIMTYYERPELRPMADFDLLIQPAEMTAALEILVEMGYVPNKFMSVILNKDPSLTMEFYHAIECTHSTTGTKIDVHWRVGSLCSLAFTAHLRSNLTTCEIIPYATKPQLAYEVFMTIVHAMMYGEKDNLNWIIDISLFNLKPLDWAKARELAVDENKQDLFDYGCFILLNNGVDAPRPERVIKPRIIVYYLNEEKNTFWVKLYATKLSNFFLYLKYLFPYSGLSTKSYYTLKRIQFYFLCRSEWPGY